ncbi:MAG: M48 family metalloprotease [Candidatus Bathyarchaeota archaeon]|nr:M48 family metalloprotease [Candidatus Bathyarchaeota archaeon]MDH5713029.1 M48 family metalloprotease [Candidatus Bathyarchaeota archaeon]
MNGKLENEKRAERYFRTLTRLGYVLALFIGICLGVSYSAWTLNPLLGFAVSLLSATTAFLFLALLEYRIDRKYKGITSSRREYLIVALPVYAIMLLFVITGLTWRTVLTYAVGTMVFVYMNATVILLLYASFTLFPRMFRIRSKGLELEDPKLVDKILGLAQKMDVKVERMIMLSRKKLKVANALQVGPRKFSIYISDYLIENFTPVQVEAVIAHELAHAKKRHLLKNLLFTLPFGLISMNLLLYSWVIRANHISLIIAIASIIFLLTVNIAITPLRRRLELEADALSAKALGNPEPMISALQRIGELNLIPTKYPRIIGWGLPHPSIETRIEKLRRLR